MAEKSTPTKAIPSVYEVLSSVNIENLQQKKGTRADSPKFISWASAWDAVKKLFPSASYKVLKPVENHGTKESVHLSSSANNYFNDGKTAWVEVEVSIKGNEEGQVGESHVVSLPVMDFRNNSITIDKLTSFDVNNTHMRALAKGLALCGLGIQMWIKDDVLAKLESGEHTSPMEAEKASAPKKTTTKQNPNKPKPVVKKELQVLTDTHENWEKVLDYAATNAFKGIEQIVTDLSKKYEISDEVKIVLTETVEESGK